MPITKKISHKILNSTKAYLTSIKNCANFNKNNEKYLSNCVLKSQIAFNGAKMMNTDPSMLPALYFSFEFKYACFSPYFLPAYLPILAAVIKVWIYTQIRK